MIQIDMQMPERCGVCFAMHTDEIGLESWCGIDEMARDIYTEEINTKRPDWCPMKEQEGYVSVPFSWLVKFCTHIDFKEPMSDSEREQKWKKKLNQQFGIVI